MLQAFNDLGLQPCALDLASLVTSHPGPELRPAPETQTPPWTPWPGRGQSPPLLPNTLPDRPWPAGGLCTLDLGPLALWSLSEEEEGAGPGPHPWGQVQCEGALPSPVILSS